MAEYIDRNGLIEALNRFAPEHYNALINQLITKYPAADVVEVVRCKDCKYWKNKRGGYCEASNALAEVNNENKDFCSYGKRKTVTDKNVGCKKE